MSENGITRQRTLRKASPYWQHTPHIIVRTAASPPCRDYDVLIVGAGISGTLITATDRHH